MRYFFIFYFLWGIVWGANYPDLPENVNKNKFNGIILRADLPSGKEIHFIPTEHATPLENFSDFFREQIDLLSQQKTALIVETIFEPKADSDEEPENEALKLILHQANKDYLKKINGLQTSSDKPWSLSEIDEYIEENYKKVFLDTAKMAEEYFERTGIEKMDLSHFYNIYEMKPGAVLVLYYQIICVYEVLGMDDQIAEKFIESYKCLTDLETQEEYVESLPLAEATLEDIKDDFLSFDAGGYWDSLQAMHEGFNLDISQKTLGSEESLAKRNNSWMLQYEDLLEKHGECLAVHGQAHFVGERGLINLGQLRGWKWFFLNEDGIYKQFTYHPSEAIEPFKYH